MTESLKAAVDRVRELPDERQEEIARLLLHEIEEDERWAATTQRHADGLSDLIDDIRDADKRGECETLDPDRL